MAHHHRKESPVRFQFHQTCPVFFYTRYSFFITYRVFIKYWKNCQYFATSPSRGPVYYWMYRKWPANKGDWNELISYMQGMGCSKFEKKTQFLINTLYILHIWMNILRIFDKKPTKNIWQDLPSPSQAYLVVTDSACTRPLPPPAGSILPPAAKRSATVAAVPDSGGSAAAGPVRIASSTSVSPVLRFSTLW